MAQPSYPRPYGSYMLLERLGQGGMSEVELARRTVEDAAYVRFLVIKRMVPKNAGDESFVKMFQDEARINAELQHENIAQVYDFGRVGDEFFLAMEYVPGIDLRQVQQALARRGERLPLGMSLRVLCDVLSGLEYAHSRVDTYGRPMRIVHRDINPRNIMLSVRGEVKIIDFGVAKADTRAEQTNTFSIKGKVAYLAPEQVDGAQTIDGRADIFAVGLVLHELIEGRSPFGGLTEVQILHRILAGRIPALGEMPEHPEPELLRTVHRRALALDKVNRYADARSMRADLERAAVAMGGLPDRAELVQFLATVVPEVTGSIGDRLQAWRDFDPHHLLHPALPEGETISAPVDGGSLSRSGVAGQGGRSQVIRDEPTPRRWLFAAIGALLAGGFVVLLAIIAVLLLSRPGEPPPPVPADVVSVGAPAVAAPAPSTTEAPPSTGAPASAEAPPVAAAAPSEAGRKTGGSGSSVAKATTAKEAPPTPPVSVAPLTVAPEAQPIAPAEAQTPVAAATTAPPPASAAETSEKGLVNVSSYPSRGFEVSVDGRKIGVTPLRNARVPVGEHSFLVRDPNTGKSWTYQRTVDRSAVTVIVTETE